MVRCAGESNRNAADPAHLNETFIMESWLDYLRSRERVTAGDERVRKQVWALHEGEEPPRISYQVYAREVANPTPPAVE
jgi:Transmembrane secretion effector